MAVQLSLAWFAWKNLGRRRLRTLLTLAGIGVAIGGFVALAGFSRSFEHEWLRLYQESGVWSASQVQAKMRGKAGSTLLIIDRGSSKANLDLKAFSPEQRTLF